MFRLSRNYIMEWLEIYPVWVIYDKLNKYGNFTSWERNLILLMKDELNHPLTIVLLQNKSPKDIARHLKPLLMSLDNKKNSGTFAYYLDTIKQVD